MCPGLRWLLFHQPELVRGGRGSRGVGHAVSGQVGGVRREPLRTVVPTVSGRPTGSLMLCGRVAAVSGHRPARPSAGPTKPPAATRRPRGSRRRQGSPRIGSPAVRLRPSAVTHRLLVAPLPFPLPTQFAGAALCGYSWVIFPVRCNPKPEMESGWTDCRWCLSSCHKPACCGLLPVSSATETVGLLSAPRSNIPAC